VPELKPVYLIAGDDDAKIDAWRARLRSRAEAEGGRGALETFDAATGGPGDVVAALAALTFQTGTRYLLADGVERWKPAELEPLAAALGQLPPDTVLVLIARGKAPSRLVTATEEAGGDVRRYDAPKPWELPKWVVQRAREEGLQLDQEAAKTLVGVVGSGQQRLAREIEKLALAAHPAGRLAAGDVAQLAGGDTAPQVYDLADALVAGDVRRTLALAEEIRRAEDRPSRLIYAIVRRLREVQRAAELVEGGVPEQEVAGALKAPPWAAKRILAQARKADRDALEQAICTFADLEVELRGGGDLDEDTAFSRALVRAASG
jgi:DNA polymerase-3 subunit delta